MSRSCEAIEAGLAVILGGAPLGGDRAFLLQLEENRIEGALIDGEEVSADLFDTPGDAVAVQGTEDIERFEDHQSQGALQDVSFFFHVLPWVSHRKYGTVQLGKQQLLGGSDAGDSVRSRLKPLL